MNDKRISINENCLVKPMADGNSAFVFTKSPYKVSLIGPIALSIYKFVKDQDDQRETTSSTVVNQLTELINLKSADKKNAFKHSVICSIGQLYHLGLIKMR